MQSKYTTNLIDRSQQRVQIIPYCIWLLFVQYKCNPAQLQLHYELTSINHNIAASPPLYSGQKNGRADPTRGNQQPFKILQFSKSTLNIGLTFVPILTFLVSPRCFFLQSL